MKQLFNHMLLLFVLSLQGWFITPAAAQTVSTEHIDFEGIPDQSPIDTLFAGMQFRSSTGTWRTGDVMAGSYNAPYPDTCPAFGGQCAYTVNGSGFAWLGAAGGSGTITFTNQPTTQVSVAFSTAAPISVLAYTPDGKLIGGQQVAANIRTGNLTTVRFDASEIGKLEIQGNSNGWIMDDLTVTMPQDGLDSQVIVASPAHPAEVTVSQMVAARGALIHGSVIELTLTATNRGRGESSNTSIRVPLDQSQLQIIDAHFSQPGVWVSRILSDTIELQTGLLRAHGDTITATLQLMITPAAQIGKEFGMPATFRWADKRAGGSGQSNRLQYIIGQEAPARIGTLAFIEDQANGKIVLQAQQFLPNEPVSFWYHVGNGPAIALVTETADRSGALQVSIARAQLQTGELTLVGCGVWSGIILRTTTTLP